MAADDNQQSTNQTVQGTDADDQISTGSGNDQAYAGAGNDTVHMGSGDDYALGGSGQDRMFGDTTDDMAFNPDTLPIEEDYDMTVTFQSEGAGYQNSVGTYTIDPETGAISNVGMIWTNSSAQGSGGDLQNGQSNATISVNAGEQIGFFLIGNGFNHNDFDGLGDGTYRFVNADGDGATTNDGSPPQLQHVAADGTVTAINGSIYHSTGTRDLTGINADGQEHTVLSSGSDGTLSIGFEDLYGGGDLDFDDIIFTIDVGTVNTAAIMEANSTDQGDDRLEGRSGEDEIVGHGGDDLLVGGGASTEWELVDGKWVYHADRVNTEADPYMVADGSDDVIVGGAGDDVLLGNAGNDTLTAGSGADRINAGTGDDRADGGTGDDIINLEQGDDYAEGGLGADIVNAGDGNDIVYGDIAGGNVLKDAPEGASGFAQFAESADWTVTSDPDTGAQELSQTIDTRAGEPYALKFSMAANLSAGATSGTVEVLWNGQVVDTITSNGGTLEEHTIELEGTGDTGVLTFRNVPTENANPADAGPEIDTSGPIFSYQKTVEIGGQEHEVAAYAPGQAKLYQVISGQLKVFDPAESTYVDAGDPIGFKVNAIGFNVEDDLIYGIAKSNGTDALGNPVSSSDLVMLDADGNAYRIGETPIKDYVGDFDADGNLWTFDSSVNRITKIDVDNLDADGNPAVENIYLPKDLFDGRTYDIAFNAEDKSFYAVEPPGSNGAAGTVHKIDVSNLDATTSPEISSLDITGTLVDGVMASGMAKGAYGAVFMDGEGNLYAGLNKGDHDLDGSTASQGGIYKINYDFDTGQAYAELMSDAESTGSNDGAVDPRSTDAFAEVDTTTSVILKAPELVVNGGGDDDLRGGAGDDIMYGNAGDDVLHGGTGDDTLSGDAGNDKVFGGEGDDTISGGLGNDHLDGGAGDDVVDGGAGNDYVAGGTGDDTLSGGEGADRVYGGSGDDVLSGGAGDDKLYGGEGDDEAHGGEGADTIDLGAGNDTAFGGAGADFIQGKAGNDTIEGGAGADKIVGGSGSDTIHGGAGNDNIWGGQWWKDGASDTFVYNKGGGRDTIHDFEVEQDQIDLSSYGLSFDDIQDRIIDRGWATEINLEGIDKSGAGDKIMLKSIKPDDLDESNFIM